MNFSRLADSIHGRLRRLLASGDGLGSYLARGLSAVFLINVAGKVLSFVTGIALARLMGPANLGVYALAMAVAQLLRVSSALGLPGVVVRYVSAYEVEGRWGLLRGLLLRSMQLAAAFSIVFALVGAWLVWLLRDHLGPDKTVSLWLGLALVPLLDFAVLRGAALQGLRRVILAQIPDGMLRPVLFLVLLGGAWLFGEMRALGPVMALGFQLVVVCVTFLVGTVFLLRAVPKPVWHARPETDYPRWRATLLPFMLVHAIQLVLSQTDILMLSALSNDTAVGLYRVAWQGAELVSFTLGIVNAVIQPMISRLYTQGDHQRLQRMVTYTARLSLGLTLPGALLLLILGPWLLSVIFGSGYADSYRPMVILIVGQLVNVVAGSVGMLLLMTGHERDNVSGITLAVILNIVLDAAFIPVFGMAGAATASAVSLMIWNLFLLRRVRLRLGIDPTVVGRPL